jgi:hypothetical protein
MGKAKLTSTKLCIVIFNRNETISLFNTFEKILEIASTNNLNTLISQVIIVDDGSAPIKKDLISEYFRVLEMNYPFELNLLDLRPSGLSIAFGMALKQVNSNIDLIMPLPGHDMFESKSLSKLINFAEKNQVTIGYRANLLQERPLLKYISAKTLTILYKIFVWNKVIDAHGLYILPVQLARRNHDKDYGHEILIYPLFNATATGIVIKQIPINLRSGHKVESKTLGRPSFTGRAHIKASIYVLMTIVRDKIKINKG